MNRFPLRTLLFGGALFITTLRAETITTYPAGTILENIAIAPGGDLYVTDLASGTIFRVTPGGSSTTFGQVPGPLAGIALNTDGTVVAVGATSVYRFAADGTPTLVTDVAGAGFLNGAALFSPGVFLVADDTANLVWKVDIATGSAIPWLTSALLVPPSGGLPIGPNGIKLFDGAAYISVTGNEALLRVPILPDGSAGTPEIYASSFQVDDFAFGSDGSIFAADRALEAKLIDKIGYLDDAIERVKTLAGIENAQVVEYRRPFSFMGLLNAKSGSIPRLDRTKLFELSTPQVLYLWSAY